MRLKNLPIVFEKRERVFGFTLAEVVISLAIAALLFGGIITAYTVTTRRAEWTGYALAAQSLAVQQLEQARSAVWDPGDNKNEITNLNLLSWTYNNSTKVGKGYSWANMDIPVSGTNYTRATNFVTITMLTNVTGAPGVNLQMVRVDTVWPYPSGATTHFFTNSLCTYLAPDNRNL
jgi:type II secretory pathway pseudopilin PulG